MERETIDMAAGTRLELWARAGPRPDTALEIRTGGNLVYRIPGLPSYADHFLYVHREAGPVEIAWNPGAMEVTFAYAYVPDTVALEGIALWLFEPDGIRRLRGNQMARWMASDPARPQLHFSPPLGWMNDPNGLCRIGQRWHLFYQFHPGGTDWGPMHWGHASSADLIRWIHLPVFLHPEQNLARLGASGGAFSGSAFHDRDGGLSFYYTERLPSYSPTEGYREIQKRAWPDRRMIGVEAVRTVLEARPDGVFQDFRDPKVWWDSQAGAYCMVLGAAIDGDPAVLLFGSTDGDDWHPLHPLWRAPARFRENGARTAECPDLFPLGDAWVLVMGFIGFAEPETGRRDLLFALVGDFDGARFMPSGDLQVLDFGADLYAMQSAEADGRRIAFAWVPGGADEGPAATYRGEMCLPREMRLSADGALCLPFAAEALAETLWRPHPLGPNRVADLPDAPTRLEVTGDLEGTRIEALQGGRTAFEVTVEGGRASIVLQGDDFAVSRRSEPTRIETLTLVHDRGIVELVADAGRISGTRRARSAMRPDTLRLTGRGAATLFVADGAR